MQSSKFIEKILHELSISISGLAVLIDVNPATIHRWINDDIEISQENADHVTEIVTIIGNISNKIGCSSKEIVKTLVSFKKSPLWKDWEQAAQMLGGIEVFIGKENYLKKHLLQNSSLIAEDLHRLKKIPAGVDVDALFKDKRGRFVAVKFYNKTVATDEYGKIKAIAGSISKKVDKKYLLVLAAPSFLGTFVEISSDEKNLKLLQYDFKVDQVVPVGLF